MNDPVSPLAVAWTVSRVLTQLGVVHTIGGSLGASFAGEPAIDADALLTDAPGENE